MSDNTMTTATTALTGERADLFKTLANARHFLRYTAKGLTDEQAQRRSTVSELTIGGLIKHVAEVEDQWARFAVEGRSAMAWDGLDFSNPGPELFEAFGNSFRMLPGETLAGLLDTYAEVAARTDAVLAELDLDVSHDLPSAPWFTDTRWSARRALLHIAAETTQHAGHADIIRESIDGQKSMG
ncbi:DinB family protein [Tsukamurella sp. 8F]|uniref:DinB family protein n=1 Tax=unclassified Tsukamurella TaxID=2633480 RepID=UPI0023BA0126|nr:MULTISPECIES: DinB family protein [unclassified Tsukamurella]MDF0529618.1 DinB family protein [Tsukamurella sp. 8J]MDF0589279.1 DinB family protein [Tsukamurella sp. 8F]